MITESELSVLDYLSESKVISREDRNLRSKVDSLLRSLENLEEKKKRLDYEIRKQRKSLFRKREELKRVSKRNRKKANLVQEVFIDSEFSLISDEELLVLQRLDSILLQESDHLLDH